MNMSNKNQSKFLNDFLAFYFNVKIANLPNQHGNSSICPAIVILALLRNPDGFGDFILSSLQTPNH